MLLVCHKLAYWFWGLNSWDPGCKKGVWSILEIFKSLWNRTGVWSPFANWGWTFSEHGFHLLPNILFLNLIVFEHISLSFGNALTPSRTFFRFCNFLTNRISGKQATINVKIILLFLVIKYFQLSVKRIHKLSALYSSRRSEFCFLNVEKC